MSADELESVWDYPRPPRVEPSVRRARVELGGVTIADSTAALRVLETSQAPAIYFPPADVAATHLRRSPRRTLCEWKGWALHYDLEVAGRTVEAGAWSYPEPDRRYPELRDHVAFYPQAADRCLLGDEVIAPNQGDFYGGWITSDLRGPFKGGPGSAGW